MSAFTPRTIQITGKKLPQSELGTPFILFSNLNGKELINQLFSYEVTVKTQDEYANPAHGIPSMEGYVGKESALSGGSPGSNWDLKGVVGSTVNISMEMDGKVDMPSVASADYGVDAERMAGGIIPAAKGRGLRHINGLVSKAQYIGVHGRHATYQLNVVPWLWLLTKTTDYKVYQTQSIPDIIKTVLDKYNYPYEYRLTQKYPQLDFQVQYGESDFDFVSRLMQEVGINYYFEHTEGKHSLVLIDGLAGFKPMSSVAYQQLYVYPPQLKILEEYIHLFNTSQALTSGQVRLSDYQFKKPTADQSVSSKDPWDTAHNELEVYEWQQGDYIESNNGGQDKAKLRIEEHRQHGQRIQAEGNLRGIQTGHTFQLLNHPTEDANRGWLVLGTDYTISDVSQETGSTSTYSVSVSFIVQPDTEQLRPDRLIVKPIAPPQTATIVGPEGKEIWTDQYGRVKVQFHWDRYGVKDENSSCWLRVSAPWSGSNYGGIQIPRIGQEVIVDFLNSDADMPYISGRFVNPDHMPLWELPSQQALSGFKSKEIDGSQNNHLIMDDTKGEIQVQLTSDHGLSQLNLGYITRIPDTGGRKDYRGQGFELRTDQWGAVRAAQGLLISTEGRPKGSKHQRDMPETIKRLTEAQEIHLNMGEVAAQNQAMDDGIDQADVSQALKTQNQEIKGSDDAKSQPELTSAHIVIASPAGIGTTTPESMHLHTGKHLAMTTGENTSIVAQKSLLVSVVEHIRMFAYKTGMKLIAAGGDIDIKALKDNLNVFAKLNITQTANKIIITAKEEIVINGGGSYTRWNGGGIESATSGSWVTHAAVHLEPGPKSQSTSLPNLKPGKGNLELNKTYKDDNSKKVNQFADSAYKVIDALGISKKGKLNKQGKAVVSGLATGPAQITIDKDPREPWQQPQNFGKYNWNQAEGEQQSSLNSMASVGQTISQYASKASQVMGAAASLTGSTALGKMAGGLSSATALAAGVGSGDSMQALQAGLGVAGSYNADVAQIGQGLQLVQGLELGNPNQSLSMPEPSSAGRLMTGGGFGGRA